MVQARRSSGWACSGLSCPKPLPSRGPEPCRFASPQARRSSGRALSSTGQARSTWPACRSTLLAWRPSCRPRCGNPQRRQIGFTTVSRHVAAQMRWLFLVCGQTLSGAVQPLSLPVRLHASGAHARCDASSATDASDQLWLGAGARGHGRRGRRAAGAAPAHAPAGHAWRHAGACAWVSARGGGCWRPRWAASLAPAARRPPRGVPRSARRAPPRSAPCRAGRRRRGRAAGGRSRPQQRNGRTTPYAGCARCGGEGGGGGAAGHGEWRCERGGGPWGPP